MSTIITNHTATAVGQLAAKHPDLPIQIEWRDVDPEWLWIITATDGTTDHVYIVDDESGTTAPATDEELQRISSNLPTWVEDEA